MGNLKIKNISLLLILFFLTESCGTSEYKEIPLEDLNSGLKSKGSIIVKDIITSLNHEDGARYLLTKEYTTPMVHGRIMKNMSMYKEAYAMSSELTGKISKYSLFQVIDKGIVKTMRYKLETDSELMKFVELKIDINDSYNLADFYLYVTSKDGMLKRVNILPASKK